MKLFTKYLLQNSLVQIRDYYKLVFQKDLPQILEITAVKKLPHTKISHSYFFIFHLNKARNSSCLKFINSLFCP